MRHLRKVMAPLLLAFVAAVSCGKAPSGMEDTSSPELTVLIGTDGFGDGCYNDTMLAGILAFSEAHPEVQLVLRQPASIDNAGELLNAWLEDEGTEDRALLLASNSFEPLLRDKPAPRNGRILIMETDDVFPGHSSYIIRRYGASWLCGAMSNFFFPIILKAMDGNDMIDESASGYTDGFRETTGAEPLSWTLADGPEGFSMRDSTYRFIYKKFEELGSYSGYVLFFPLLGGSLPGVFDFSRYRGFIDIAGMDVDCSSYNPQIVPFSLCINNHLVLEHYLEDWLAGRAWPEHAQFGLESTYVDVVANRAFSFGHQDMAALYEEYYGRALEKEKAYEAE